MWDIAKKPAVTRITEQVLNPVLGKSLVVYATKPMARTTEASATGADALDLSATRRETADATA